MSTLTKQLTLSIYQNDDGPPGAESPYIFGLYQHLTNHLSEYSPSFLGLAMASMATPYVITAILPCNRRIEWNVRVVIPSSQKSWIGKCDVPDPNRSSSTIISASIYRNSIPYHSSYPRQIFLSKRARSNCPAVLLMFPLISPQTA